MINQPKQVANGRGADLAGHGKRHGPHAQPGFQNNEGRPAKSRVWRWCTLPSLLFCPPIFSYPSTGPSAVGMLLPVLFRQGAPRFPCQRAQSLAHLSTTLGRVGATLELLRPGPALAGLLQVITDGHDLRDIAVSLRGVVLITTCFLSLLHLSSTSRSSSRTSVVLVGDSLTRLLSCGKLYQRPPVPTCLRLATAVESLLPPPA